MFCLNNTNTNFNKDDRKFSYVILQANVKNIIFCKSKIPREIILRVIE